MPQPSELFARASEYVAYGWSVLPLCGKIPATPWKSLQTRRPSTWELSEWFLDGPRRATGLAIVTGRISELIVVDCDSQADAAYWQSNFPLSPLVVETGGGGVHFYYALARGQIVRNRTRVLGRRIDLRGEGGYVATPPSRHASGQLYRWSSFERGATLPVFDPAWLQADEQLKLSDACFPKTNCRQVRNAVAYIQKIHAESGKGGHNATFRVACRLRDAGLLEPEALAVLCEWNETHARPPWSVAELEHKIRSAYDALRS
jgi:hypothetical protein